MEILPIKLDFQQCKEYVHHRLGGLGYFYNRIVAENIINSGSFYAFAPKSTRKELLYHFDRGGNVFAPNIQEEHQSDDLQISSVDNHLRGVLLEALEEFLNEGVNLLFENWHGDHEDERYQRADVDYFLAEGKMQHILDKNVTIDEIAKYYRITSSHITMPILFDAETRALPANRSALTANETDAILNSICTFFLEVYDGDSYLVWIRDDQTNALPKIETMLERVNAGLVEK